MASALFTSQQHSRCSIQFSLRSNRLRSRSGAFAVRRSAAVRVAALFGGGGKKDESQPKKGGKEKMSAEQYTQLAQQARGTARDFFKSDTKQIEIDEYVDTKNPAVPFLPLLLGIAAVLVVATVIVAQKTA